MLVYLDHRTERNPKSEVRSAMQSPIRKIRSKLSMTQHQMALALGISQSHVSHIELGYVCLSKHVVKELSKLNFDKKKLVSLQQKFVEYKRQQSSRKLAAMREKKRGEVK